MAGPTGAEATSFVAPATMSIVNEPMGDPVAGLRGVAV
jgi:hypothetical protein